MRTILKQSNFEVSEAVQQILLAGLSRSLACLLQGFCTSNQPFHLSIYKIAACYTDMPRSANLAPQ